MRLVLGVGTSYSLLARLGKGERIPTHSGMISVRNMTETCSNFSPTGVHSGLISGVGAMRSSSDGWVACGVYAGMD